MILRVKQKRGFADLREEENLVVPSDWEAGHAAALSLYGRTATSSSASRTLVPSFSIEKGF